jgi:hypothetical protein
MQKAAHSKDGASGNIHSMILMKWLFRTRTAWIKPKTDNGNMRIASGRVTGARLNRAIDQAKRRASKAAIAPVQRANNSIFSIPEKVEKSNLGSKAKREALKQPRTLDPLM